MSSQRIQDFLQVPDSPLSEQRTLDSLNEHFGSIESLDTIENAAEEARQRGEDFQHQLDSSRSIVDDLVAHTRSSARTHLQSAKELSLQRHALADELSSLSLELVSSMESRADGGGGPTLLEDIETLHRSLKELESIKGYVQVIEQALELSEAALQQVASTSSFSEASATKFKALHDFVQEICQVCATVESRSGESTLHVIGFLNTLRSRTWARMKSELSSRLISASEKLHWPMPVNYVVASSDERKAFESAFANLIQLQQIGEKFQLPGEHDAVGLYPLQALVQPISLRFKYHFDGKRQTNRLDKPEWYFTHILNVVHEHRPFLETVIQPLLSDTAYCDISAWREFSVLLLPLLTRKLRRMVPQLLAHPSLLAHTIYQSLSFDAALLEEGFGLEGTFANRSPQSKKSDIGKMTGQNVNRWDGVSEVILDNREWFDAWMEAERKFAADQYNDIISAADAWLIVDDDISETITTEHDLRPTNSARRIKVLVEQVTGRYSPLPQFNQRTRFLIHVQLPLLESYHGRISSSLDAFETLSSSLVRAVPGALSVGGSAGSDNRVRVDTRRLTDGVEGTQRLCKALVSARFIENAMASWGEEVFFLELWSEINHRASLRTRAEMHPSLPDPKDIANEKSAEGTIFEELVTQYAKVSARAEDMIVQQVCGEIETGLKAHFSAVTSPRQIEQSQDIAIASTLLGPVALLSSHLTFLRSTLPNMITITLYRRIVSRLSDHILQREILYRGQGRISVSQGKSIHAECELWVETCRRSLLTGAPGGGRARIERPWSRLVGAGRLLGSEGDMLRQLIDGTGPKTSWEESLAAIVGGYEMARDEVGQILRLRDDYRR